MVAIHLFISAVLAAGAAGDAVLRRIDALPLGKLWTQSVDGPVPVSAAAGSTHLLAGWADHFDAFLIETGAKDWSLPIPATRAACDAAFCVVADDRAVRGIDLPRRAVQWQRSLDRPLGVPPTVRSGWVLLASNTGVVRALQALDGREVWSFDAGSQLTGPPSINGNRVAIATAGANVSVLDLRTGRVVWTAALERVPGAPRLGGGSVMVGTAAGRLVTLDDASGRLRFETRTGGDVTGAPTLDEKHIYVVGQDGVLRAFDRGNGAQRWYGNLATRASDGPHVDGDLVFVPLRTGAIEVRLIDGKAAVQLPAPSAEMTRLPMAPIITGAGSSLSVLTVSYDLNEGGKWSLTRYGPAGFVPPSAVPAKIPGFALKLTAPQ